MSEESHLVALVLLSLIAGESVSHSAVSDSVIPRAVAHQAPMSMELSKQEYLSGLPFPSPGDLPDPGIEPGTPTLQADALPSDPVGKHIK